MGDYAATCLVRWIERIDTRHDGVGQLAIMASTPDTEVMATTTTVSVTDDIDGSPNATTVSFSYDGVGYEIDLAKKSKGALDKALKPYIAAARKAPSNGTRRQATTRTRKSSPVDLSAIRAWAGENGHAVSNRGRIASTVVNAYRAAH